MRTCASCSYWKQGTVGAAGAGESGACRRHAPVTVTPTPGGSEAKAGQWPLTLAHDWCGDWESTNWQGTAASLSEPGTLESAWAAELAPEEEQWLRNTAMAQALLALSPGKREEVMAAVLTEEEREEAAPPADFYERVQRYFSGDKTRERDT